MIEKRCTAKVGKRYMYLSSDNTVDVIKIEKDFVTYNENRKNRIEHLSVYFFERSFKEVN